ncbi:MAG: VWA domain-containing protein, partial [Chloroflexi bacterium]|nr:VWA domain-containing protein [Chloroflexota bacterium]
AACGLGSDEGPPRNAAVVEVVANTSLGPWLTAAVETFNESETKTSDDKTVYVVVTLVESGQAVTDIAGGAASPVLWLPDDQVWTSVLANHGNANYQGDCASVARSPLVIAMWRPVAESLGWPGLPLGWLDVGSLAADPSAWDYYSGGEFGDALRLGHTHPGLSGSGTSTLLAIVQAAESKTEAVTVEDINQPIVQASVSAFEAAVSWFSANTDTLGQTMSRRGITYLGAAVMYESTVVAYGNGEIVPIYPLEGTFVATHPACLNRAADSQTQEAAGLFRDYLVGEEAQQLAVANGLRPVNNSVTPGAPLDAAHGVDLDQPQAVFNSPTVDTVYAVQELWQESRKDVNLVMLIDVSGSMRGDKIDSVRQAAIQFMEQMGDDDYITLITFSDVITVLADHEQVSQARDRVIQAIDNLNASGDTALYDAIGDGATAIANTTSSQTTNAMVVLSDGQDTYSYRYDFGPELISLAAANGATVFTIAYGGDADEAILSELALGANGNFYRGDEASIAAIYEEMSAAFGGSVGVGR